MMPLSAIVTGESFCSSRGAADEDTESEPIPLPIQSFLWRQTHPFLGARVSKLQDASCMTFERVIVQNILHGISPSLSDAIGSVSRWSLVRAAFPHIVQCCAALLTERCAEEEDVPMSGSLVKSLYILHWLLIDAAAECNENNLTNDSAASGGGGMPNVRQLTYSVSSVQLFVYLLAPLFDIVREDEIKGHYRLESGVRLWQCLWQSRLPELICFCAPVKQRRSQMPQMNSTTPWAKRAQSTAAEQGIYIGDNKPSASLSSVSGVSGRRQSQLPPVTSSSQPMAFTGYQTHLIPPPKPPRTDAKVLKELEEAKHRTGECGGDGTAAATIVRSVSDYKASEQQKQQQLLTKSHTTGEGFGDGSARKAAEGQRNRYKEEEEEEPLSPDLLPGTGEEGCSGIRAIEAMFLGRETSASEEGDGFSAAFEPSLNGGTAGEGAPLVRLNDICNDSTDADSLPPTGKGDNGSGAGSMSEGTATIRAEGARGAIPKTLIVHASGDDTPSSLGSQQTIVSRPPPASAFACQQTLPPPQMPKIALGTRADSGESERQSSPDTPLGICLDPHEANYLDVAVLRCLLIRNWAEEGTFWAVQYLLGRLIAMRQHRCTHEGAFRSRFNSDSATIPTRKTSKTEAATIDTKGYLTWANLQEHNGATFSGGTKRTDKTQPKDTREERTDEAVAGRTGKGVAFERDEMQLQQRSKSDGKQQQRERQQTLGTERTAERRRRISLSAMPSDGVAMLPGAISGSMPRPSISSPRRMQRASSIPASFPRLTELLQGFASTCNSPAVQQRRRHEQIAPEKTEPKRKNSHFFTEAIGAASFIEPNGHLSFLVVLKVLGTLMERCCVVRVSEVVLNCCDTFLNMPGSDAAELFPKVLHIVLRISLQLGCPNGCNEGVHTPQAEFLRIKVRNLIAQMHRTNPRFFCALLRAKVAQTPCAQLVDALHSLMVFCQCNFSLERSALASHGRLSVHREGSGAGSSAESGGAFRRTSSSGGGRRISAESAAVSRMPSYKNNFNQAQSGIEGVLMGTLLGPLLDKMASSAHELGQPENMSYAQDIRLLLAFAFDRHGNPFRRNALSSLSAKTLAGKIDAIGLPAGRKSMSGSGCGLNIGRGNGGILLQSKSSSALISASNASPSDAAPQPRDGAAASLRRGLFRRMQSTTTATSDVATAGGDSDGGTAQAGGSGSTQSTPPPQLMPSISVDDSIGSPQQQQMTSGGSAMGSKRAKTHQSTGGGRAGAGGGRLQFALSFLKGRSGGGSADPTNSEEDDGGSSNAADDQPQFGAEDFEGGSLGGLSMDAGGGRLRADKALLRRGEGLGESGGRGAGRGSAGTKLTGGAAGGDDPLVDIAQQHKPVPKFLPPQRIVQAKEVRAGAARFAFLLENSRPGTFPDSPLVAAISELRSPVLARAVLLVECAHFVHRCNRGDWPDWIRSGMFCAGQHRTLGGGSVGTCPTVPPTPSSNPPSSFRIGTGGGGASRRTALLQRASGRAFYAWGVQLGLRLQKQLDDEAEETKKSAKQTPTMAEQRQLRLHDELEDFLDDASVNDPRGAGDAVPVALQLIVCALLQQITAFLRETLQSLPRASHSQKQKNAIAASSSGWERLQSQRRWSILSNTFNAQTQQLGQQQPMGSGSMHSINELHPTERRVSYSTADEENSPRGSHDMAETEMAQSVAGSHVEKGKVRRLAQGRQRLLKRNSPSGGAIQTPPPSSAGTVPQHPVDTVGSTKKRASLRLRKPSQTQKAQMAAAEQSQQNEMGEVQQKTAENAAANVGAVGGGGDGRLRVTQPQQQTQQQQQSSPERYSSSTNATANAMFQQQQKHLTEVVAEEDEEEMCRSMPWLNTLLQFGRKVDFDCPHEQFCTKWCFERICRQCQRLFEALTVVYGQGTVEGRIDRRQQFIERWQNNQQREAKKRHSSNPPRRESATVRQSGVDRMPMALRGLIIEKLNEIEESRAKKAEEIDQSVSSSELRLPRPSPIVGFLRVHLLGFVHAPLSALLKGIVVLKSDQLIPCVKIAWTLLIASDDSHLVATAAALFICCAVKCPQECSDLMSAELASADPSVRNAAVQRFFVLWRQRFHVWLKMEEGAQLIFKIPPPSIDFTLPSPSIGLSQLPVVDPPWMPPVKTKVEELSLKEEEQSTSQTIMTMTRTRRKQKQEMVRKAIRRAEERQRELREQYPLRATAVVQQVAYEPALFQHQLTAADSSQTDDPALLEPVHQARQVVPVAQPLFPSAILSVVPTIVELLDDAQVDGSGVSVGETCRRVIWSCFVEDTALFLRHFFEKFTNRTKQEYLLALLRRLVLSFHPLPSQTAHTLLNALFGLAMFYVRTPGEGSDRSLALALSLCWLVVPFVHGLYFKDLKQTLKKEQCDQAIMVTANVPSAKKVIVHGPDSQQGGIPTQFPVLEDTQFQHLLADSIEFYNIPAHEAHHFFLYDPKTFVLHNPSAFVRDFYFFHRSFYPQLQLVRLDIGQAQQRIREHALQQKLIETGKVLLTHNALRHSPEAVIPQRIFFLHDEFTHLPSFPRRAVETCFGMYRNTSGAELQTTDALHKFAWSKLIANMFEKMENAFMFGDLHLFINVINGIMIIHCEDVLILRRCMAAYLGMSIHFNSLFASQGFSLIMPTILRCYSQRQPNRMFTQVVEFVCKQFYVLHRKPFLLQMFGSCADLLDQSDSIFEANPMRVKAKYLFALLLAMERMNEPLDQLDILAMLPHPKPLQALDLCYRDEPNTFNILTDAMASCVTICAFAPESRRAHQMLLCMQSMLPHLVRHMEEETNQRQQQAANALAALKLELSAYATLSVELRALVNSCDVLARGPTRSFDLAASGGGGGTAGGASLAPSSANRPHATDPRRGRSLGGGGADSPQFFDPPTIVEDEVSRQQQSTASVKTEKKLTVSGSDGTTTAATDNEAMKEQFRGPRDGLLTLCSMFVQLGSERLKELGRLSAGLDYSRGVIPELLDHKCHIKLSEVAVALLKLAPYDSNSLGCAGLRHYFTQVMPVVDWSVETNRSAINIILRRLDKTIAKIAKRPSTRHRANWGAISFWLVGLHQTLLNSPYIAHLHSLKTITLLCLRLTLGDPFGILDDQTVPPFTLSAQHSAGAPAGAYLSSAHAPQTVLSAHSPPASFCNVVLRLTSFLMTNLGQLVFSLEMICGVESIGPLAERPEAILCQFLIPMFLRAAIPGKEAPQFRAKDLNFCLSLLQNAISPPSLAKQSVAPAMSGSSLATSLMKDTAGGRQGSVSVTDRGGYSATVSTTRIMRDSVVLTVMLAIKVIVIAFHKQLTIGQWMRIARIVREIVAKKCGGAALSPFLKFMLGTNLPVTELLQSIVLNKLNQRTVNDIDANWVGELRERIARVRSDPTRKSHLAMLRSLHSELYLLREDFITRNLEVPRSHTPTIGGELHSDSGSSLGGASAANRSESTARRLSSTALGKLRWIQSKSGESAERSQGGPKVSLTGTLQDSTILEDAEDENASGDGGEGATVAARVSKSPSLPFSRRSQRDRRGLGMFRSVRRMRQPRLATSFESEPIERGSETPTTTGGMELDEVTTSSQLYSSLKRVGHQNDKSEKDKGTEDNTQCTTSQSSINKLSTSERPRVVSFSTPRHSSVSQTISEADSDGTVEFCITSTKHLI